jgi:hypothetical protein
VLATVAGVAIALVPIVLTWVLAKQAKRQADLTQRMFEASHRPYVDLRIRGDSSFRGVGAFRLDFVLQLHGQVPALIDRFYVTVTPEASEKVLLSVDQDTVNGRRAIYPEEHLANDETPGLVVTVSGNRAFGINEKAPPMRVQATLEYRGAPETRYKTHVMWQGRYGDWAVVHNEVT